MRLNDLCPRCKASGSKVNLYHHGRMVKKNGVEKLLCSIRCMRCDYVAPSTSFVPKEGSERLGVP